jgi:hypothetical protein
MTTSLPTVVVGRDVHPRGTREAADPVPEQPSRRVDARQTCVTTWWW